MGAADGFARAGAARPSAGACPAPRWCVAPLALARMRRSSSTLPQTRLLALQLCELLFARSRTFRCALLNKLTLVRRRHVRSADCAQCTPQLALCLSTSATG